MKTLSASFVATLALVVAACSSSTRGGDEVGENGADLAAKWASDGCPIAVRCAPGYHAVDTDDDGCNDTCEPDECTIAIKCAPGYHSVDTDNDGCNDTCEPD